MADWVCGGLAGLDDAALGEAVVARFRAIYGQAFGDDSEVNHALPIQVRALRRTEGWCIFLLLTPWMLARFFVPERDPGLPLPAGWSAAERTGRPYRVIGPALPFSLLGQPQQAHLNHDALLGHHLVQPLVQSMSRYAGADAVFGAWNDVIATRMRVMAEQQRECRWQRELSRREFFGRLAGRAPAV